jgi:hypothetical protein
VLLTPLPPCPATARRALQLADRSGEGRPDDAEAAARRRRQDDRHA